MVTSSANSDHFSLFLNYFSFLLVLVGLLVLYQSVVIYWVWFYNLEGMLICVFPLTVVFAIRFWYIRFTSEREFSSSLSLLRFLKKINRS